MRHALAWSFLLVLCSLVRAAAAEPPSAEDASAEEEDVAQRWRDDDFAPRVHAPLWLSVGAFGGSGPNGREVRGTLELGTDLDSLSRPVRARAERAKTAPQDEDQTADPSEPSVERTSDPPPPRLTGPLARAAVRASLAAARSSEHARALDDLATRARLSGLLPELRVRLAHALDHDQKLSPTEYDPDRVTASGGTSLWIEGRATFRLDRLVFADDEVAIARLRAERERAERAIVADVLRALERWQRAEAAAADPTLPEPERIKAELDAGAAEATLDVATDGWFASPLARRLRGR